MLLTNRKKTRMVDEEEINNKLEYNAATAVMTMSILDLPELTLECILVRLPPAGLCTMAGVCSYLRDRCRSDHLWERHLNQKWGRLMGPAAHREWLCHIASRKDSAAATATGELGGGRRLLMKLLSCVSPLSWFMIMLNPNSRSSQHPSSPPRPLNSIMSWYLALETGRFCFPAQVYNRENGHAGFILSCYDAELNYDPRTDTFQARYPPHGSRATVVENGVPWERLRVTPVDSSPHDLHISDCLNELRPGHHIEIQWRRNKEFPYGWWYGVVGHLESCDGNENYCRCHNSDSVELEFNQYTPGSRWRRAMISRKDHEEGNEANGFYGGLRKLHSRDEISTWKRLWPTKVMQ